MLSRGVNDKACQCMKKELAEKFGGLVAVHENVRRNTQYWHFLRGINRDKAEAIKQKISSEDH